MKSIDVEGQILLKSPDILLVSKDPPAIRDQTLMSFCLIDNSLILVKFHLFPKLCRYAPQIYRTSHLSKQTQNYTVTISPKCCVLPGK